MSELHSDAGDAAATRHTAAAAAGGRKSRLPSKVVLYVRFLKSNGLVVRLSIKFAVGIGGLGKQGAGLPCGGGLNGMSLGHMSVGWSVFRAADDRSSTASPSPSRHGM